MALTPKDIHDQTFRVTLRGFNPEEVDKFLQQVAEEVEILLNEKTAVEIELAEERARREDIEKSLGAASQVHEAVMVKAREEGRTMVFSAQRNAEEILGEARRAAEEVAAEARRKAAVFHMSLEAIREKRIGMLSELAGMAESLRIWVDRQPDEPGGETGAALEEAFGMPAAEEVAAREMAGVDAETEEPLETLEPAQENPRFAFHLESDQEATSAEEEGFTFRFDEDKT
jgi:cell division initiation protein